VSSVTRKALGALAAHAERDTLAALGFGFAGLYFAVHPTLRRLPAIVDVDQSTFGLDPDALPATAGDGE